MNVSHVVLTGCVCVFDGPVKGKDGCGRSIFLYVFQPLETAGSIQRFTIGVDVSPSNVFSGIRTYIFAGIIHLFDQIQSAGDNTVVFC